MVYWHSLTHDHMTRSYKYIGIYRYLPASGWDIDKKIKIIDFLYDPDEVKTLQYFLGKEMDDVYLTKQEYACMKGWSDGLTIKEIASNLGLSHRTVEYYLDKVKKKLKCKRKKDLIRKFSKIKVIEKTKKPQRMC